MVALDEREVRSRALAEAAAAVRALIPRTVWANEARLLNRAAGEIDRLRAAAAEEGSEA